MKPNLRCALVSILLFIQSPLVFAAQIPDALKALHVLERLGYGPSPGDIQRVNAMGVENYIHQQLNPDSIPLPAGLVQKINELTTYNLDPNTLADLYGPAGKIHIEKIDKDKNRDRVRKSRIIIEEAMKARLMQAIESPRQLQEVMVDFWFNHFNVFGQKGLVHLWVGNYERVAIRPFVMGHFRDLLEATAKHPAMLFYLDNWQNVDPNSAAHKSKKSRGLNENYARELMELHTLGVNGGYTQDDVIALAKILTGWGFHGRQRGDDEGSEVFYNFYFNEKRHDMTDKVFLGQTIPGQGEEEVEQALDILVKNPSTAHHICFQLAQYFVADEPDPALVDSLSKTFQATNGDIKAVLQAIFDSPQFWDEKNVGNKFKTPYEYVISTIRASGKAVTNFHPVIGMLKQLGEPLYGCLTPDGYKNTQAAWLNGDAILKRINFATALALGRLKINEEQTPISFEDLVSVFDNQISSNTMTVIQQAQENLRSGLLLGSPEMMEK